MPASLGRVPWFNESIASLELTVDIIKPNFGKCMNELYDTKDSVGFGQFRGVPFYWIYRLNPDYLQWLIHKTKICFTDTDLFQSYGPPIELIPPISDRKIEQILDKCQEIGRDNFVGNSESYILTVDILNELCRDAGFSRNDFQIKNFNFSQEALTANKSKLVECRPSSNFGETNYESLEIYQVYNQVVQ